MSGSINIKNYRSPGRPGLTGLARMIVGGVYRRLYGKKYAETKVG